MDVISGIFAQYSLESIILLMIGLGLSIKLVEELWEWFYNKARKYFNYQNQKDQKHGEIISELVNLRQQIEGIQKNQTSFENNVNDFDKRIMQLTERMQEDTRSFIIDKHHYFVYVVKAIDDLNLQSLERHYLYYKLAGGDSFIDGLMEEIRSLPRLSLHDGQSINVITQGEKK